jgi:DNA polymerase III delta prime subunit
VGLFDAMRETGTLTGHFLNFKEFMQHSSKNVLFLFGPSGCGKTLLVTTALRSNQIPFEFAEPKLLESESEDLHYEDTSDLVVRLLGSHDMVRQKTFLFKDFPVAYAESGSGHSAKVSDFRRQLHGLVSSSHNRNKYIFVLNSEIYSSYAVLSEQSENRSLGKLPNVAVIKMDPYGIRDMKAIIDHFVKSHSHYAHLVAGKNIDEIVTEANGDARKALNLLYHRRLAEHARLMANRKANAPTIKFYSSEASELKKSCSNLGMKGSKQSKVEREEK